MRLRDESTVPTVRGNDISMYFEVHGEGEPLALILGLATDVSERAGSIQPLAQHYQVITIVSLLGA